MSSMSLPSRRSAPRVASPARHPKSVSSASAARRRWSTPNASSPSCGSRATTSCQSYDEADVVVVNTCGFIDSAVAESLDAIGEAMAENGKVIVTGCLGKRAELIREAHPGVLSISGPQDYASVMTRGARGAAADARSVHRPACRDDRHQADAEALRLPEDFRRLQPPLQLLHHPVDARRPGVAPGRRSAARSREAGDGRRAANCWWSRRTPAPTASTCATPSANGAASRTRRA